MATKATGIELKAFYADKLFWPDGAFHEDEVVKVDGVNLSGDEDISDISDSCVVVVSDGVVLDLPGVSSEKAPSFEEHFKKWLKLQSNAFMLISCPKDKLDAVVAAIASAGGKVIDK